MSLSVVISVVCLILGVACVVLGLIVAWNNRAQAVPAVPAPKVGDQGEIADAIKNVTEFSKALKDLDLSGKLLVVGVLFVAIAATTVGLDSVANAISTRT